MSYLVLYEENSLSRLRIHIEDDDVPQSAICWDLASPQKANRALNKIKKFWLSGSVYEKGALLVIGQAEAAEEIRSVLGPSLEDCIEAKVRPKGSGAGILVFAGIMTLSVRILWISIKMLMLIALVPILVVFVWRRL